MNQLELSNYINLISAKQYELASEYKNTTIPVRLYKYYSLDRRTKLNKSKLSCLEQQKIYLSSLDDFNDPFEGKFFIFDDKKLKQKGWNISLILKYYDSLKEQFKVTCLSDTSEQNMPMWAYYANSHHGFCVEYEFNETQKKYIFPVQYEDKRQYANSIITNLINQYAKAKSGDEVIDESVGIYNQLLFLSLTAKHSSWNHENEYRILSPFDNMFPATPRKIYIGCKCSKNNKSELVRIGRGFKGYCSVYEMYIDRNNSKFELQKKQLI
jgi:hypothetical protein